MNRSSASRPNCADHSAARRSTSTTGALLATTMLTGGLLFAGGMATPVGFAQSSSVDNAAVDASSPARFDGHRLVRVFIADEADWTRMIGISSDHWNCHPHVNQWIDFRVTPEAMPALATSGLRYEVVADDIQVLVDQFNEAQRAAEAKLRNRVNPADDDNAWYEAYHPLDEVSTYVDGLVDRRPDIAERVTVGQSVEGREIYAIRITAAGPNPETGVLYHGLQHAREWITVPTMVYLAEGLIDGYGSDPAITDLLDEVVFYIIPIVNPDGYEYTWTNNRLWRKNRQGSFGVDLNRNWAVGWGGPGSGGFRFLDNYRGPEPFSEPETQALRDFMLARPELRAHIDFHSYSQLIMHAWGFTREFCRDHDQLLEIGGEMSSIVQSVNGKFYDYGNVANTIYLASGGANDWTYGAADMLGYAYELRDEGQFGFLLPPDQIIPTCEEIFPAAIHLAEEARALPPRMLLDADPLQAGAPADLRVTNAGSNADVYFVYSLIGTGWTPVTALNHGIGLRGPSLIGSKQADSTGTAVLTTNIPSGAPSIPVWLQAVRVGDETNIVVTEVSN